MYTWPKIGIYHMVDGQRGILQGIYTWPKKGIYVYIILIKKKKNSVYLGKYQRREIYLLICKFIDKNSIHGKKKP